MIFWIDNSPMSYSPVWLILYNQFTSDPIDSITEMFMYCHLYFVSPQKRPWCQPSIPEESTCYGALNCIYVGTCVFSHAFINKPRLMHKGCALHNFIVVGACWRHSRSSGESKSSQNHPPTLYIFQHKIDGPSHIVNLFTGKTIDSMCAFVGVGIRHTNITQAYCAHSCATHI